MTERKEINLVELLLPPATHGEQLVFEDEHFRRQSLHTKLDPAICADIITDSLISDGVRCCHISLDFAQDCRLDFVIHGRMHPSNSQGRLITHSPGYTLLWIPTGPVSRLYDNNGRIETATQSPFEANSNKNDLRLSITGSPGRKVEFSVVIFTTAIEALAKEILDCAPVELRKVTRSNWFYYEGAKNVWDYLINGYFFNSRHKVHKRAWPGQNIPYVLYHYLDFLARQTKKQIYRLLCDLIAYSVMLSLPDDGRWRHGIWSDINETHTVHQIAGINIFLSYYQRTARDAFLGKAKKAMDFLISIADTLSDDNIWFLHDTLETNMTDSGLFYKIFGSTAFGKSTSNTLCINSHILTLSAMHRINRIAPDPKYDTCFEKGLNALKQVLQAAPRNCLFATAYRPRDILIKLCTKTENKTIKKLLKVWTLLLRRHLLPFLKKKSPRLLMPNGFIERDLSHSVLSDFYHFRNLEDILILYNLTKADWLLNIITKSVKYTVHSRFADYVLSREPKAILFLDIILLYSDMVDEQYLHLLPKYLARFQKANSAVPVNILSDPFITNTSSPLYLDNENVIITAPAGAKKLKAVMINPTGKDQKVMLKSTSPGDVSQMKIVDSTNRKFPAGSEIVVPKMNLLKIVSKDG